MDYFLTVEETPETQDIKALERGLDEFNFAATTHDNARKLAILLRDSNKQVVGGLFAWTYWNWLEVKYLWIKNELRGKGYGSQLLLAAEKEAIHRGCDSAFLDTFSFQAPNFYQKLGYSIFGVLEGFPLQHQRYFLKKNLIEVPHQESTLTVK
jgi:GNAT superfamily N-acetyltransferase